MEEEKIRVEVEIKMKTYKELEKFANFLDVEDLMEGRRAEKWTVEDMIKSAIMVFIDTQMYGNIKRDDWLYNVKNNKEYKLKNRFKEYIDSKEKTYTEVIEQIGLPKSTFSQILSNNHEVSLRHFLLIWSYLRYPPVEQILYFEKKEELHKQG